MKLIDKAVRKLRTARHLLLIRVRPPAHRRRVGRLIAPLLPGASDLNPVGGDKAAVDRIREDGFVMLEDLFPTEFLRRLRAKLEERQCKDGWHPEFGVFDRTAAPAKSSNIQILDVEETPEAVEIANHPRVLSIVSSYLGCKPTIDDIVAWWSLPGRELPFEEQFFHRDQDSIRFVKLFVQLSDVGPGDGPHVFVRGSHRRNELLQMGKRFTDEEVMAKVAADDVVKFTGPMGTCFLEDTYGLHKGEKPEQGTRLMLQVRYTMLPSMFAAPGTKKARVEGRDPYINRLIAAAEA
ncbi:MAG TPA: phytanoyl-CoA dioxygenase family protein [Allosphingosinicella sp.]|jgi:hypothetical protein